MNRPTRSRAALAFALIASAAVFAVGVAVERSQPHHTHREAVLIPAHTTESGGDESTTQGQGGEQSGSGAGGTTEGGSAESTTHDTTSEQVFGINTESTGLVVLVVVVSAVLAAGAWYTQTGWLLLAIAAFASAAAVFDLREALHQTDESHTLLITLALIVAALHAAAAVIALGLARRSTTSAS